MNSGSSKGGLTNPLFPYKEIKINELINIETAMMVYRSMNNEAPSYLTSLLKRSSRNTVRELRNTKNDLKLSLLKTSSGQKCFSYRGTRLWNNLSADATNAQTKFQFKNAYNISKESFVNSITF